MLNIGRRFFYSKIMRKVKTEYNPLGVNRKRYTKAIALFLAAVIIAQMFSMMPGVFAGIRPLDNDLWSHPDIDYNGRRIYNGMQIPIGAELNASYEFTIRGGRDKVEVFLPDELTVAAGEYDAAAFYVNGRFLTETKVKVDRYGKIEVQLDGIAQMLLDIANAEASTDTAHEHDGENCCESHADETGSGDDNDTDLNITIDDGYGDLTGNVTGDFGQNDENGTINPDGNSSGNSATGSSEPVGAESNSGTNSNQTTGENSENNTTTDSGSSASNTPASTSATVTTPEPTPAPAAAPESAPAESSDDDSGMHKNVNNYSASMFNNVGSLRASAANTIDINDIEYIIKFEIPVEFDEEKLPEQPEPDWDKYEQDLIAMQEGDEPPELHVDPWLVDIFNVEYKEYLDEYEGKFVKIEIIPELFEEPEMMAMEIMALSSGKYTYNVDGGTTDYKATVNWNDNNINATTRPSYLPAETRYLQLQLYYYVTGMTARQPLTAELLVEWGAATGANPTAATTAANAMLRVEPGRSGTTMNFWEYGFKLPKQLFEVVLVADGDGGFIEEPSTTPLDVVYTFDLEHPSATTGGNNIPLHYIIERYTHPTGTDTTINSNAIRCTLKEVFKISVEWKDGDLATAPGRYNTRRDETHVRGQLELRRLEGAATGAGTVVGKLSGYNVPTADVYAAFTNTGGKVWGIEITGLPAFNSAGIPYNYYVVEKSMFNTVEVDGLLINTGHNLRNVPDRTPNNTVRYEALYENVGNFSEEDKRTHNGGTVVNRLIGEAVFRATKTWLDDGATNRPNNGRFLLNRYPDITGRSYRNASPVQGMSLNMETPTDPFNISFGVLGTASAMPRFDLEGQEYVYFVQELYDAPGPASPATVIRGPGEYVGTASYPDYPGLEGVSPPDTRVPSWWGVRGIKNKIYNGGVLTNLREGSVDLSVTKRWEAIARQDMNSEVSVLVERRLGGSRSGVTEGNGFVPVTELPNGIYTLTGFRAEVMAITHEFGSLPKYNNEGIEYIYQITENEIVMKRPAAQGGDIKASDLDGKPWALLDGYRYTLQTTRPTPPSTGGNTLLTNTLVGETEIKIRKIWNGVHDTNPRIATQFTIHGNNGQIIASTIPGGTGGRLFWETAGGARSPAAAMTGDTFIIPEARSWRRTATAQPGTSLPDNAANPTLWMDTTAGPVGNKGDWLVITGLPRYDDRGREIEYTVRENPRVEGYTNTFFFGFTDRPRTAAEATVDKPVNEKIGVMSSSFINTPSTGGGRYVSVNKVWADDGDQACRGPVTMRLWHNHPVNGWTPVNYVNVSHESDWRGDIRLTGEGGGSDGYDHDYNNYIVVEESISRGGTAYPVAYFDPGGTGTAETTKRPVIANYNGTIRIGTVRTNAHYYNVFAPAPGTTLGSDLNTRFGGTVYDGTTPYRTSYTFRNVRTGEVAININKSFVDANYHVTVPQRIEMVVERRFNASGPDAWESTPVHTISLNPSAGSPNYIQGGAVTGRAEKLSWSSTNAGEGPAADEYLARAGYFPKYDKNGALIHYRIRETRVQPLNSDGSPLGSPRTVNGGHYTIERPMTPPAPIEKHQYAVSIDHAAGSPSWGDHNLSDTTTPRPDVYTYTATNQRSETITGFTVHKLWHDVERTGDDRNSVETRQRPDIYFRLWMNVGSNSATGAQLYNSGNPSASMTTPGDGFAEHVWSTSGGNRNEYYWTCTFIDLPRYTSVAIGAVPAGTEIFYFVDENMPNAGEYKTYYWNTVAANPAPILAPNWIWSDADRITNVAGGVRTRPLDSTDANADGVKKVSNNGIIINRREETRGMHGRKIWENVPGGLTANSYPTITMTLRQQDGQHKGNFDAVEYNVPNVNTATLANRATEFRFTVVGSGTPGTEARVAKYDDFGIYKKYRAVETSVPAGYLAPVYNDFTMDVTNKYNPNGPIISGTVVKSWNFGPYHPTPPHNLEPVATIELWRVMTFGGADLGSPELLGSATFEWKSDNITQEHTFEEMAGSNRLLRYGVNGEPYRYFLKEKMDGYVFTSNSIEVPAVPGTPGTPAIPPVRDDGSAADPTPPVDSTQPYTVASFNYALTALNTYDGSTDSRKNLVLLSGNKDWANDRNDRFNTRPEDVALRVYRAINATGSAWDDITDLVTIEWNKSVNANRWSYTVNANDTKVGALYLADGTTRIPQGTASLHRYTVTGVPYVYFVEEICPSNNGTSNPAPFTALPVNNHYTASIVTGTNANAVGTPAVPAGNFRVRAATVSDNFVASFRNTMKSVEPQITKTWMRQGPTGGPEAIDASEAGLMLPDSLTFKVQYRVKDSSDPWRDLHYSKPGTELVTHRFDRAHLVNSSGVVINPLKLGILLPQNNDFAGTPREYRMIETHIGGDSDGHQVTGTGANAPSGAHGSNTAGGGYTVTYNGDGNVINTIATIPIFVIKEWKDNDNHDGLRPGTNLSDITQWGSISFRIVRDGNATTQAMTRPFTQGQQTSGVTIQVPAYRPGGTTPSTYTTEELVGSAPGEQAARGLYELTSTGINDNNEWMLNDPSPTDLSSVATPKTFRFENSHTKIRFNIEATKTWDDSGIGVTGVGADTIRPPHVHLELQRSTTGNIGTWAPIPDAVSNPDGSDDALTGNATTNRANRLLSPTAGVWTPVTVSWTGVIARGEGIPYHFRVAEVPCDCSTPVKTLEAYTATITPATIQYTYNTPQATATPTTVEVKNVLDTVSLAVTKNWQRADGSALGTNEFSPTRPIQLQVLWSLDGGTTWTPATGSAATAPLNGSETPTPWAHTFANLPKENNAGTPYLYTVREVNIDGTAITYLPTANPNNGDPLFSYERNVTRAGAAGGNQTATVTNKLVERTSISVTKRWNDNNNQDGVRPATVQVVLVRDGVANSAAVTLSANTSGVGANWSHTWNNLPKYQADGKTESVYTVREILPSLPTGAVYTPGYQVVGVGNTPDPADTSWTAGTASASIPENCEVFIRNTYTPKVMNIVVTKTWNPAADPFVSPNQTRPDTVMYRLIRSTNPDAAIGDWETVATSSPVSYGHTFPNLPIRRNTSGGGSPANSVPLYYRIVELRNDGTAGGSATLYGYDPTYVYNSGAATSISGDITVTTGANHTAAVTNTLRRVDLSVNKVWTDYGSQFVIPTADKPDVEVKLYFRLGTTGDFIEYPGNVTRILGAASTPTPWAATFTGLPRENGAGVAYQYTVREIRIGTVMFNPDSTPPVFPYSYRSTVSAAGAPSAGVTVTNDLQRRDNITVTKVWADGTATPNGLNQDGVRPEWVDVQLIRDMNVSGQEVVSQVRLHGGSTNPGANWTHTWTNLPQFRQDGVTPSTYHVRELPLSTPSYVDYTIAYQVGGGVYGAGTAGSGAAAGSSVAEVTAGDTAVNVRNTYTPKTMSIKATKAWDDQNDVYDTRPDSVQLQLVSWTNAAGTTGRQNVGAPVTVHSGTTNPGANWTHTWDNLPIRRNIAGTPTGSALIFYSVEEVPVAGYLPGVVTYTLDDTGTASLGAANANTINGSIQDTPARTHEATVTNSLDTVNVEVLKVWDDHRDLYGIRPDTLTFTLQRRSGSGAFADVSYVSPEVLTVSTGYPAAAAEQSLVTTSATPVPRFSNLPKFDTSGTTAVPWEYRVLETSATGIIDFLPDPTDPTKGTMGDTNYNHYSFSSETASITGGFRTTVTNKINVTTIQISGTKGWIDGDDVFGTRPDTLKLEVWYYETMPFGNPEGWKLLPETEYDPIVWDKTGCEEFGEWTFTITGFGLAGYVPKDGGGFEQRLYAVREREEDIPEGYELDTQDLVRAPVLPGAAQPDNSTIGERDISNGNIVEADFVNFLDGSITEIQVDKRTNIGPRWYQAGAPTFTFNVYFSYADITEANPGRLYNHHAYTVVDTVTGEQIGDVRHLTDGNIKISAGQGFVLKNVPQGINYNVVELEHENYITAESSYSLMRGKTSMSPTQFFVDNDLLGEVSIVNITPNEGVNTPSDLTNAGGLVRVQRRGSSNTIPNFRDDDEEIPGALAVMWQPEGFWTFGEYFTVTFIDWDDLGKEISFTIRDYMSDDRTTVKPLTEVETDNKEALQRFIDVNASIRLVGNTVLLVLSDDVTDMPFSVTIEVKFVPTLAVNNVTENNAGGTVVVNGGGTANNNADGVPALGTGMPYIATSVYGKPDPGYRVDWDYVVIRNLNDLTGELGEPVFAIPDVNGYFTTELDTWIAGRQERVVKTGRITEGSIIVELDGLPVPLQIDLRFIPDTGTGGGGGSGIISDKDNNGGLPRTGVESVLVLLVLGLATSLVAGVAVAIVIRRINAKERGVGNVREAVAMSSGGRTAKVHGNPRGKA